MRRYSTYRYILLLSIFLLSISFSACASKHSFPVNNNSDTSRDLSLTPAISDKQETTNTPTPTPTSTPTVSVSTPGEAFNVRGVTISLGEDRESVIKKLGSPNRIDDTEYNFDYYIYNSDYTKLVFVAISNDKVVGFYSDSLDFNYLGIHSGSSIQTVNKALNNSLSMDKVLTAKRHDYTVKVLMDKIGTQKVTGIYILSKNIKQDKKFTATVKKNIELMVYDLTNSIRVRNKELILTWSSSAALSSRKHSIDMAKNDYFSHNSLIGRTPDERLMTEGIYFSSSGENIIAGYGTAILSTHAWFNSNTHRKNLLNVKFRYLGVGFSYEKNSTYKTYITQNFYR